MTKREERMILGAKLLDPSGEFSLYQLRDALVKASESLSNLKHSGHSEDLDITGASLGYLAFVAKHMQRKVWSERRCRLHVKSLNQNVHG